ncbi:uncharacterized protein BDZ99DRAFT_467256 [Mytilinidion resinicola]|uniref:Glyoxalase-like domain-containing protein n=1 Tax=Mytilinidion resinicola TaxID=574789 RepID=A0A6A6Y793_9PEZI|nr:uncharacterized protein BDZ99DRAFT_467256 [Mytilinidion resinicola]KAF2804560.1 hypothetical protein BDZ99DRAFT_467256 [Mytilinidion resinicola]
MPPPHLDHIVIFVPYASLQSVPTWLTTHFTVSPGGRHGDNKTENKLILLPDGCYIELIAFIDDGATSREGHWWGDKKTGIADLAFTTEGAAGPCIDGVAERLTKSNAEGGLQVVYQQPQRGARNRPDGTRVEWEVTFPTGKGVQRGLAPFFCHDVTPRDLRVPLRETSARHPSGAYGVKSLTIMIPGEEVAGLAKTWEAILDSKNEGTEKEARFTVGSVHKVEDTPDPVIIIKAPEEEWQKERVKDMGFLISDLKIGAFNTVLAGTEKRVDADEEFDFGRMLLEYPLPPAWPRADGMEAVGQRVWSGPPVPFQVSRTHNAKVEEVSLKIHA